VRKRANGVQRSDKHSEQEESGEAKVVRCNAENFFSIGIDDRHKDVDDSAVSRIPTAPVFGALAAGTSRWNRTTGCGLLGAVPDAPFGVRPGRDEALQWG